MKKIEKNEKQVDSAEKDSLDENLEMKRLSVA